MSSALYYTNYARIKSRDVLRIATLKEISKAVEMYYDEYGYYPVAEGQVESGRCEMDPFDVALETSEDIGGIMTIKDTSVSDPWIPQLEPPYLDCESTGESYISSSWLKDPVNKYPIRYGYYVKEDLSTYELTALLEINDDLMI